ncbi:MAG: fibrobacter succinogenes major paralogous domain-containing protein, partial [Dysgonamonadaceae bacterium]|nr:fibrobacter succinogenes major paralogous domain-containing protein [Dysgonamonadaceae bacterium]
DTTSNRQGICPDGWTLPSDYDWNQLEKEIATYPGLYSTESDILNPAGKSEYESQTDWRPSSGTTTTSWGRRMKSPTAVTGATNGESKTDGTGFNAFLVGTLESAKDVNIGTSTIFFSSSAGSAVGAWRRRLDSNRSGVYRSINNKFFLFSVRCKK